MAEALLQQGTDSTSKLCSVCHRNTQKYTCPRCSARTCSLPCSTGHKTATGCSGERNKAAYVPMNGYSWGTMMDDYAFLENIGRHVGEWGKEIVQGGFTIPHKSRGVSGRNSRLDGLQSRKGGVAGRMYSKRNMLKTQFEARGIDMDLLPMGMERQKLNKSYWDSKTHTAFLSIEFKVHPPRDPFRPSTQPLDSPHTFLTHKNSIKTPLLTLIRQVVGRTGSATPSWTRRMLIPDQDDPESFIPPHFVMPAHVDPRYVALESSKDKRIYYRFEPDKTLADLLRNTHFVEFPTIEVWEEFKGRVIDVEGVATVSEPSPKRKKLTTKAGMRAINGLLDGYGSDDEEKERLQCSLATLGGYAESDIEGMKSDGDGDDGVLIDSEDEDDAELSPSALLKLIRQVQGDDKWLEGSGTSGDEEGSD